MNVEIKANVTLKKKKILHRSSNIIIKQRNTSYYINILNKQIGSTKFKYAFAKKTSAWSQPD